MKGGGTRPIDWQTQDLLTDKQVPLAKNLTHTPCQSNYVNQLIPDLTNVVDNKTWNLTICATHLRNSLLEKWEIVCLKSDRKQMVQQNIGFNPKTE